MASPTSTSHADAELFEDARPGTEATVARVGIRTTPFWKTRPELWFSQLEAQFETSGIVNENTKFPYVIQSLDESSLGEIADLLVSPRTANAYSRLKERLIGSYSDSEEKRLRSLIHEADLGDKKPSQLLRYMKELSQGKISDSVLKSLWLQRLPRQVQAILTASDQDLESLSRLADKIVDVTLTSAVSEIRAPSPNRSLEIKLTEIVGLLRKLDSRITSHFADRSRSRQRDHSKDFRARSKSRSTNVCWYHRKFGEKAHACIPPCVKGKSPEVQEN